MLSKGEDLHPAVEPFDRRKIRYLSPEFVSENSTGASLSIGPASLRRAFLSKEVIGGPLWPYVSGFVSVYWNGFTFLPGREQPTTELSNPTAINPRAIRVSRIF